MTDRISVREASARALFDKLWPRLQRLDGKTTWETTDEKVCEGLRQDVDAVLTGLPVSLATLDALANGTHRVVPVEPTEAMLTAGVEAGGDWPETTADAYRAMIAAAGEGK